MKELHFMQDEYHHLFCFPTERGLATIFLVHGLGIEDQQNDLSEAMIFSRGIWPKQPKARTPGELE
jgi:hypothetical protein